ncbi:hypothetical protein A3K80_09255 [Candidatus Bathyarchaeota archaeon RBG_13_38_9]|nr:MAG: hypothetical protein A3K80_09255 [Candidatus Bathyarchaeota archaeon RBG_13_38_9]
MGTNYYLRKDCCDKCGRSDEIHIGHSSDGWCFSLHVTGEIKNLDDWLALFKDKKNKIFDQSNREVLVNSMKSIILDRNGTMMEPNSFYKTIEEFYIENHAEPGPNNLARHKVDGHHCIGHGDGTYDLITGEFS